MNPQFARKHYPGMFLAPVAIIFTLFFVMPAALGLWLSFTDATIYSDEQNFIGWKNYDLLFGTNGDVFFQSIGNQALYAVLTTIGKTVIGVALAFLLNRVFIGRNLVRAIVYLPIMFSTIVIGIIFNVILARDGTLNSFFTAIGLDALALDWFGDFNLALFSVAAVDVWMGVGWTVVIVLAAIQAIPADVVESAQLDGARGARMFFSIKLPFIMHAVNLAAVLTFIAGMKAFDLIYATTGGGPGHATEVMSTFIAKALSTGSLGYPAAASFVQFALITVVALIVNMFVRKAEANQD